MMFRIYSEDIKEHLHVFFLLENGDRMDTVTWDHRGTPRDTPLRGTRKIRSLDH